MQRIQSISIATAESGLVFLFFVNARGYPGEYINRHINTFKFSTVTNSDCKHFLVEAYIFAAPLKPLKSKAANVRKYA